MPDLIIDDTIFQEFGKEVLKKNKKYERWHNFFKTEDYKKSSLHDLVELIKPSHEYIIKSGGVESPKDKTIKNLMVFFLKI